MGNRGGRDVVIELHSALTGNSVTISDGGDDVIEIHSASKTGVDLKRCWESDAQSWRKAKQRKDATGISFPEFHEFEDFYEFHEFFEIQYDIFLQPLSALEHNRSFQFDVIFFIYVHIGESVACTYFFLLLSLPFC